MKAQSICLYLDNNIWDYLYKNNVNIERYFPKKIFSLFITKQGFLEIIQMPKEKNDLKNYVLENIQGEQACVTVKPVFGFYDDSNTLSEQRYEGFDSGSFSSNEECSERERLKNIYGKNIKRKESNIMNIDEADIELAVQGKLNIVITFDTRKGPLSNALKEGSSIIMLNHLQSLAMSVEDFLHTVKLKISGILI